THMNKPDSTTCGPDTTPGDACVPGCEAGQCVQTHVCVQLGCRVTGGGRVDACGPGDSGCDPSTPGSCAPDTCDSPALNATHGGQVGAPIGVATPFTPDSACIAGEWRHVRHIRPRLFWFVGPAGSVGWTLRQAVACAKRPTEDISAHPANIGDGGDLIGGNQQIHPPPKKTCTP